MPKQVPADSKTFQCEWCSKRYKYASGKSAHEKSHHSAEYKHRKLNRTCDIAQLDVQSATQRLQQKVFDKEIDMVEYQKQVEVLEARVNALKEHEIIADLDMSYLLGNRPDYDYIFSHLLNKFNSDGIEIIIDQLIDGSYSTVFLKVFQGQIRHFVQEVTGEDMLEYIDNGNLVTVPMSSSLVSLLLTNVIKAIFISIHRFGEEESDIISNDNISEDDIRRIQTLSNFDRSNSLIQSAAFDQMMLYRQVKSSLDKFQADLVIPA